MVAIWFQGMDVVTDDSSKLIVVFIGLVALALLVQALVMIVFAAKSIKASRSLAASVEELKQRALPLIDTATEFSREANLLLRENAPKVRTIADNLVETSDKLVEASSAARAAVQQFDVTIADANRRAQRQVARVDGMVSATLTATAEIAETIASGIRGPVKKIASMTCQAGRMAEGVLAAIKAVATSLNSSKR